MNDSCSVMYINVCYEPCIMLWCLLVHQWEATQRAEDVRVKLEPLSLTSINCITGSVVATRCMLAKKGPGPGSVYTQKGAMKDVLARYLKKTDVQVCTLTSVCILFCNYRYSRLCYIRTFPCSTIMAPLNVQVCGCNINTCLFFAG